MPEDELARDELPADPPPGDGPPPAGLPADPLLGAGPPPAGLPGNPLPAGGNGAGLARALQIEMALPPPSVARSLRLSAGELVATVTVSFEDPDAHSPVALTTAMLRPDLFRIVVQGTTSAVPPGGLEGLATAWTQAAAGWEPSSDMPFAAAVAPQRAPRRARYLIPPGTPRRREILAALTLLAVLASLLFAQVTLGLTIAFHAVGKISRWSHGVAGRAGRLRADLGPGARAGRCAGRILGSSPGGRRPARQAGH